MAYDLPVFGVRDGKLTSHFSLTYIENAQMLPDVRKLTDAEHEAIQMLMDVAQEECFEMRFAPGDIQLLNNHVIYHGRTAFKDDVSSGQDRMLMRLWLSVPNSRALPDDHAVLWGDVGAGKPHGGIAQPATVVAPMNACVLPALEWFCFPCCCAASRKPRRGRAGLRQL